VQKTLHHFPLELVGKKGSVANAKECRKIGRWRSAPRLRGDPQRLIDETDLADYISLSQPPDLTFSDHVHRLISTYRVYRTSHRTKPEAGGDPLLDESMVLLHDIVQIGSLSTAATCAQFTGLFQFKCSASKIKT
jgi:hypothetical protein